MPLSAGTRLASYEILGLIGAGGMGEVYRARDTRLKRDVAIKVLPDAFAADPDRVARFEREAQVLASLNHPTSPRSTDSKTRRRDPRALVLELVAGPRSPIVSATGRLPLDEALRSQDRSLTRSKRPTTEASSIAI